MTKYSPSPSSVAEITALAKALADENRVRVLAVLRDTELCVCEITELLDLAPSTVSRHLSVLRQAGLVQSRKLGRWVHVRRAELPDSSVRRHLIDWIDRGLPVSEPTVRDDCCRLEKILAAAPERT